MLNAAGAYLERLFSRKHSVAHFALDAVGRAGAFQDEVADDVRPRTTPFTVVSLL